VLDGIFYIIIYLYITVQEEGLLFWKVTVLVIVGKKNSNEHVSNSEWLPSYRIVSLRN